MREWAYFLAGLALASMAQPASSAAPSAVNASNAMYKFWCTPERAASLVCKQHTFTQQLRVASGTERANVLKQLADLGKEGRFPSVVSRGTAIGGGVTRLMKDYSTMKVAAN